MLIGTSYGEVVYVALPSFEIISVYQHRDQSGALLSGISIAGSTYMEGGSKAAFAVSLPVRESTDLSGD